MSWLSTSLTENLTNITGQISTFTKDMLTEGTVEVDDHETELKIAKSRVRELELTLYTQREEYDRIKELNHELQERAEAAELQITSISREYRTLLQEKENEVIHLQEQLETWKEHGCSKQDHCERFPSFSEDSFVESTNHDEVQYLQTLVSKLQEEKKQWSKSNEKENLHKELDHYQHELATLHTTYSQRIATLNKKHKQEIEELESCLSGDSLRIQELEQQLSELRIIGDKSPIIVVENLPESESDFEIIKKESVESDLQAIPDELSTTSEKESVSELKLLIDRLECENQDLKERLDNFELQTTKKDSEIAQLQQENKELIEQRDQAVISEAQTSASLESLREELSRLGTVTMELMKEVEQSQGVDKEKSIEIESLKKLCRVRRSVTEEGDPDEVMKLKDMLAVLWQKYASVVLENEKVRLEVLNIKRRLLNQLQDRHGDTKSILDGVSETRVKLTSQLEGHQEQVSLEKQKLMSMIPEVENEVENHEESVSRLVQESDVNKTSTKDIVNDFGRRWSVSNQVASLQAEKAVLERTIVGLEEKVQELEQRLRNQSEDDTPRSSVSTVVSVESLRAPPHTSESGDDSVLTAETGASHVASEGGGFKGLEDNEIEEYNKDTNTGFNENCKKDCDKDYDKLMEKLREYEETIEQFELIKEDWEGEKEALENVLVQLRKKLKDIENNHKGHNDVEERRKEIEKRYLNDIKELLIKKNYVSEEELNESANENVGEDSILSCVLEWLKREQVEELVILRQENNPYYSAIPGNELDSFIDETEEQEHNQVELKNSFSGMMNDKQNERIDELINATKNELEVARNECGKTKDELDEINTSLKETKNEFDIISTEGEKSRVDLENARIDVDRANERAADLESKLKSLKSELEDSQVHFNNTISEKDGEVHRLRNVVEKLQGTLSNFENDKANTFTKLQEEIGNLHKELGDVTSSCETMATKLEKSKQELALVVEAKNSLGAQISEVVKEKQQLLEMVNERDVRIEELQDLCDSFEQKTSFLQDEGNEKSRAYSELSEENSLLKEEKSDLFNILETKENQLNSSLRESEKLSELLREQELASEEMRRQNSQLAKDLENWRIQLEELNQTKELLNRSLDAKSEEILSLKESNIELANQRYENSAEISEKLSMLEQLVSENLALKSENETLMEALSQKKTSEKELKDSYNLLVQEKEQLDVIFSKKSSEIDHEIRRKTDEIEVLRLEVARLTKECQEKDHMIRAQVSANLASGSDDDVTVKQEHIRRILQEKDVEIDALRTKNESLLTLFADNEQEKEKVRQEHEKQITTMLERQERMLNELNDKSDQMIALEDRLEMLNIKSASKDQASALIHAEHQKLLHLNESQSEEIGRLREKVTTLGVLVAERDHSASGEVQKLRQRNSDLQLQVDALQGEQERLLMVVHDKDQLLSSSVQESPVRRNEELFVNAPPPDNGFQDFSQNEDELRRLVEENRKLTQEIISLQNNASFLNDSIENERNRNRTLAEENDIINQHLRSLELSQTDSGNSLRRLQIESEKLKEELSAKERQILAEKEEKNMRIYEINTLKNEKDEIFLEQNSQVEELRTKLSSLLDVISSNEGFKDEQFEILENREDFERLVARIKHHRARLLSDKENEVRLLKEQMETLSSVQNISNPELEAKLEQFIHEKEEMNKRLSEMENEKLELLEEKENEMTSLQMQVVDISNVLKQKERKWLAEKESFSEKNSLLEKRINILEQERNSWNETRSQSEKEISRLRDEITSLTASTDLKLDVVLNEKDRKVKDLERELDGLKQRYSRSLQEAQDMKSELDTAREQTQEFEMKKEKELERLRTHLLQVEDSYTQEALASEERENELRHQLEQIQQQLLTSSHSLQDSTRTASMKMENLQEQLINITARRDELQAQLEQSQEQTLQYMRSVENLQMVLEQFQREKESELKNLRENNREQLNEAQREVTRLRERELELKQLLQNASDALNKADKLSEDLKSKEDEIENLKMAVSNLELDLQSSHDKLRKLTSNNDNKIEKGLMKNMLLAYFNTSEHKRSEVVAVLGHILNFTEDEIKKVGTGSKPPQASGWFSGLLSYSGNNQSQQQHDKSFSELFVSFLEKESESELMAQSGTLPGTSGTHSLPSGTRPTTSVTAIPARLRDSPLPISPLASSTPYGNTKPVTKPLLMNAREEASGSSGTRADSGNALLGSSLRPSLDLPTITKSSSSSTALREILFNN